MAGKEKKTRGGKQGNFGHEAEQLAADYLRGKGYVPREMNWNPPGAHVEVDIITQLDDTMVFVEVKSRLDRYGDPMESITPRKIRFLTRAADSYLRNQPYDFSYRFDVITVVHGPDFPEPEISHYEDAFLPPLSSR